MLEVGYFYSKLEYFQLGSSSSSVLSTKGLIFIVIVPKLPKLVDLHGQVSLHFVQVLLTRPHAIVVNDVDVNA